MAKQKMTWEKFNVLLTGYNVIRRADGYQMDLKYLFDFGYNQDALRRIADGKHSDYCRIDKEGWENGVCIAAYQKKVLQEKQ